MFIFKRLLGNVGIGTTSPANKLNVEGTGNALNVSNGASCSYIAAGATSFTACSSRNIKENITAFKVGNILQKIADTPVNTFDFINGTKNNLCFIAEDFYPVLEHGSNKTVSGQDVQSALWLGTQELIKENRELKGDNAQLKSQNSLLNESLAKLSQRFDSLEERIAALESVQPN